MKFNRKSIVLVGVLSAALLALPIIGSGNGVVKPITASAAEQTADKKVISVNGQGEMTVDPDVAYISFGIQTQAKTANEAQVQNAQLFNKLEKVLYDSYKIDKKDVKTTGFTVQPVYTYPEKGQPEITSYSVSNTVEVTYRALTKIGELLDAASKAGVNQVNSIQFSTEKSQEYELQVIEKAMANAEQKAKVIAKFAGKELKGILSVSQNGGGGIPIMYANYDMYSAKAEAANMAGYSTPISSGQLKITTNVSVVYEF